MAHGNLFPQPLPRLQHLNDDCDVDESGSATVPTVDPTACLRSRLAAAVNAFILKILTEQELGFPTELVQDGLSPEIPSNLTGLASVYEALESGAVHMYPEVARDTYSATRLVRSSLRPLCRHGIQKTQRDCMRRMCSMLDRYRLAPRPPLRRSIRLPNDVRCLCRWCRRARWGRSGGTACTAAMTMSTAFRPWRDGEG